MTPSSDEARFGASDPHQPDDELLADASHAALDPGGVWGNIERKVFATNEFFRLWLAQCVTSIGDWIFFLAITITAARVGGGTPAAAIGFVVAARIIPGFFFSQFAGVLADRWDRRHLMITCDLGRAAVVLALPFVDHVWQLVVVSLALEGFTLLWIPAKEASVPNLLPREHLTTANSLSLFATYGTFPLAALLFVSLAAAGTHIEGLGVASFLRADQASLAFYVDAGTFLLSAGLLWSIRMPQRFSPPTKVDGDKLDLGGTMHEFREGWRYIFVNPSVRAVTIGLATGLVGGGMLIPLGSVYSLKVLDAGERGFGAMATALGVGVGLGVLVLTLMQKRFSTKSMFVKAVFGAGIALLVAASLNSLGGVVIAVGALGVCAGAVYVLGFTILHEEADDEVRGRIFAALYSLIRLCVFLALVIGPFLAVGFDRISEAIFGGSITLFGVEMRLPGVRWTLWLAGMIIIAAGVMAALSLKADGRAKLKSVDP